MNNVLIIGSGGREHALSWRLKQSPSVARVFCSPGNAGIAEDVTCVALGSFDEIAAFCKKEAITLVVVGPEQPLVDGLSDHLRAQGIAVFGPSAKAAQLEGSKGFMKELCRKYNIPTAAYGFFDNISDAKQFIAGKSYPLVIKADGLAAGKGVVIAQHEAEAQTALSDMFSGKIAGGSQVIIEEFLDGEELSFFALADGERAVYFGAAQDHKRAYDGDAGPNTGGMGTYAPPSLATSALVKEVMTSIIEPTLAAMKAEGAPFTGVLFAGLMLTKDGPKLLEYNVRFGDPETQSLMRLYEEDLFALLLSCANGELKPSPSGRGLGEGYGGSAQTSGSPHPNLLPEGEGISAVCIVMAAKGYPGAYDKGSVIRGLDKAGALPGVKVFHAGTSLKDGNIIATGGRVLGITATANSLREAQALAYQAVDLIDWPEGFCRRDIGWRALK
ncbi:MAG: phosphoribosylamine--glycine ligase [Alphaproteobacteria bacterium]|nr:phosphoribosylamine--glycine ligase [Alphaproteobacteria bacterium]